MKKPKVGSPTKSSPFTRLVDLDGDTSMSTVAEDEASTSALPLASSSSSDKQNVVVCVRMRPTRSLDSSPPVWSCDASTHRISPTEHHPAISKRTTSSERAGATLPVPTTHEPDETYSFTFDHLLLSPATTSAMFTSHIAPVIRAAMEGYNGTVFAYGQTGSGKTHTMSGSASEPGVIPRAVEQVFELIEDDVEREYLLRVSYLEIYNETLKDLLAPLPALRGSLQTHEERPASPVKGGAGSTLRIIEDRSRVLITGLREEIVTSPSVVLDLLQRGQEERHVGATDWNERSSRSHCVFTLTIESHPRTSSPDTGKEVRISQLNLIDLAGSERAASQAERRKEGAFINKSLLTLGTVIGKLAESPEASDHIPYRDSKLTRILQTSLSGNARIAVICTLSPDAEHAGETLSTLKFGRRCKMVVTTARKGTSMDDKALLQRYRRELDALRAKLEGTTSTDSLPSSNVDLSHSHRELDQLNAQRQSAQHELESMQQQRADLRGQIEHLTRLILTSQSVADSPAGPSTPIRARNAHASALTRRGPRMSDWAGYSSPVPQPGGEKPFELETQLAGLRRQVQQLMEARETLVREHAAEMAQRDRREAELEAAMQRNKQELQEAGAACEKLKGERDEAREAALEETETVKEVRRFLDEQLEANRLSRAEMETRAQEEEQRMQAELQALKEQLVAKEAELAEAKERFDSELAEAKKETEQQKAAIETVESQLAEARKAADEEKTARSKAEVERAEADQAQQALQVQLVEAREQFNAELAEVSLLAEEQKAVRTRAEEEREEVNKVRQALQAQLAEAEASAAELKQNLASKDDAHAELQEDVRKQDEQAQAQLHQRQTELEERKAEIGRLRAELEANQTRQAESEDLIRQQDAQAQETVHKREAELAEREEQIAHLQAELGRAQQRRTESEQLAGKQNEEAQAQLQQRQAQLDEREAQIEVLRAELEQTQQRQIVFEDLARKQDETLQAQLQQRQGELVERETQYEQLRVELEQSQQAQIESQALARKQGEEAKAQLQQRQAELREREAENERLRAELEQSRLHQCEAEQKDAQIKRLCGELNESRQRQTESEDLVRKQDEEAQAQLQRRQAESAEHEVEMASIRAELEQTRRELGARPAPETLRELASLQTTLSHSEAERRSLQAELAEVRAAASARKADASTIASLHEALERANTKLAALEADNTLPLAKQMDVGGSTLRPASSPGLSRTGSVKEYRRYQSASPGPPSASPPASTRSVILTHQASPSRTAERDEIDRLNAVISSQRALMSDLEHSVASWKDRLHAQTELIHRLMAQPSSSPPVSDTENACVTPTKREESFHTLPRTTHLALTGKGTPTKSVLGSWNRNSPSPLPVSDKMQETTGKRKPRKTIELDMKLLNSSPRVEGGRTRFGAGAGGGEDTPTKRRGTTASQFYV
ncbi:Kinesin, motor domain protein [Kalmanozyma brasiliensis GHG001]|uniref:Kinesin motor domain-containing protein n=1 Tax=Kalmanozyma brasiliensis (strain GHG001) TaxID=1365824 RepID=V5F3L8_KALBG|nr:Kinesin, motor domain protein [Kalmanozyma brasiliensis GHG001]EST10124.1 Kinesin, motor domain protein [Kalmanozyma brasiliensis GHG001]